MQTLTVTTQTLSIQTAMIEVLESSSTTAVEAASLSTAPIVDSAIQESVDTALDAIVQHYRDPIHSAAVQEERLPYFHTAETSTNIPPVVQHWVNNVTTLQNTPSRHCLGETATCIFNGYSQRIRPTLFSRQHASSTITLSLSGIPVMQHYEILLSQMLQKGATVKEDLDNSLRQQLDEKKINSLLSKLQQPLEEMATDITLLTKLAVRQSVLEKEGKANNSQEPSLNVISNIVLPTLIRLLTHGIDSIVLLLSTRTKESLGMAHDYMNDNLPLRKALQKSAVGMLAFGYPRMNPRDVLPSLETNLLTMQEDPSFMYALSPDVHHPEQGYHCSNKILDLGYHLTEDHFWNRMRLDGTPWEALNTGTVLLVVERFWEHLLECTDVLLVKHDPISVAPIEVLTYNDHDSKSTSASSTDRSDRRRNTTSSTVKLCLQALSRENCSEIPRAIRAHFFGRDVSILKMEDRLMLAPTTTKTRLHLGRVVPVSQDDDDDEFNSMNKAFMDVPSRVHVALHYILLLQQDDVNLFGTKKNHGTALFEEMLPVIYELLSSHEKAYVALGSAALMHAITLMSNTSSADKDALVLSSPEPPLAKYAGSLLPVLNDACQTCRDGAPLVLLARAQSMVCDKEYLFRCKDNDDTLIKHRRTTTSSLLTILNKHSHEVSDPNDLLWSLLVGGILPLLYQHSTKKEAVENVDAMEMGRLGLTALLPILRYSSGWSMDDDNADDKTESNLSRKLLAPSVLALVYLLQAAYPIMPRHGGKIMSELLALLGNLQRQTLKTPAEFLLVQLTKNAAGIALAICGDRAEKILELVGTSRDSIFSNSEAQGSGCFEPAIAEIVEDIRIAAAAWIKSQQQLTPSMTARTTSSAFLE